MALTLKHDAQKRAAKYKAEEAQREAEKQANHFQAVYEAAANLPGAKKMRVHQPPPEPSKEKVAILEAYVRRLEAIYNDFIADYPDREAVLYSASDIREERRRALDEIVRMKIALAKGSVVVDDMDDEETIFATSQEQ